MSANVKIEQWPGVQQEALTAPEMPCDWLRRLGATSLVYPALEAQAAYPIIRQDGELIDPSFGSIVAEITGTKPVRVADSTAFSRHGAAMASQAAVLDRRFVRGGWPK